MRKSSSRRHFSSTTNLVANVSPLPTRLSFYKPATFNQLRAAIRRRVMNPVVSDYLRRKRAEIRRVNPVDYLHGYFNSSGLGRALVCGRRQVRKEVMHALGIAGKPVARGTGGGTPSIRCR